MRSADQMRQRLLDELAFAIPHASMYGVGRSVESYFLTRFRDLLFLDERDPELDRLLDTLKEHKIFGCAGTGPKLSIAIYRSHRGYETSVTDEIASVYAEVAYKLGYLQLQRVLSMGEWQRVRAKLYAGGLKRDWHVKEIREAFGPPSLTIGGNYNQVLCYVSDCPEQPWLHLDHDVPPWRRVARPKCERDRKALPSYKGKEVPLDNPLLRDMRWQTHRGWRVMLTPYGRHARELCKPGC